MHKVRAVSCLASLDTNQFYAYPSDFFSLKIGKHTSLVLKQPWAIGVNTSQEFATNPRVILLTTKGVQQNHIEQVYVTYCKIIEKHKFTCTNLYVLRLADMALIFKAHRLIRITKGRWRMRPWDFVSPMITIGPCMWSKSQWYSEAPTK